MPSVKIKKNDIVCVLAGKDKDSSGKGKTGKVLKVIPGKNKAIVEGLHFVQKHTKPNPQKNVKGGILPKEAPIHISNLMVVCKNCNKPTRVGMNVTPDGKKYRVCKKCKESLDA
ncbi:MAG: 50S ribosomal protein L24 [Acidobacteriota bacterium]|jgi:large subunit ribosomal protein L24|nr:50S ribosomal protein L24 [Acidobacteriota bacterium]